VEELHYFSQLLSVYKVSDIWQIEVHTAETLVPGPSSLEAEIASDQISVEMIQVGGLILLSAVHKLIIYICNKGKWPDQWKEYTILPVHKKGDRADCNKHRGILLLSISYKFYGISISQG
jgi:hypothetical protein